MRLFVILISFSLCFNRVYLQFSGKETKNNDKLPTDVNFSNNFMSDDFDVIEHVDYEDDDTESHVPNDGPQIPFTYSNYKKNQIWQQKPVMQATQGPSFDPNDGTPYTREIIVKQGRLKGSIRIMHPQSGLKNVEQYLAIPYAEAPVGSRRFMPPGTPIPWNGIKVATKLSPVCPQVLPSLNHANNNLSKGRYDQIKRLLPYLKSESEDCLYLNLYVPSNEGVGPQSKYPVIVFVHGESYEWNSGNPYDGSILSSYGQVIVVTLNFRLGILGFMKPGISDHVVSNFGLLDQIAALQWIKENIGAFGGDNKLVTVMGHGTGAALVNFLMVSPVAKGLFHRAILMSGSALSDWALTQHPLQVTMQVLSGLNCPVNDENEEMLSCLRKKRYSEILSVKTSSPKFSTRFGPIVDGLVIPNTPHKVMGQYSDIFSGYDLLYGMTELESYHTLDAVALTYGLLESERNNLLRFYMQNRFEIRPELALAATLNEYTDIYSDPNKALADEHRDTLLEVLSDARVAAPLVQTGLYLSKVNPKCYMYVFAHNSEAGEYGHLSQSVVGEDLAYIFGAPLGPVGPFQVHYNPRERLFSEAVMKYFSNFAKTGNPKIPWKELFLNLHPNDWSLYDIDWPNFNQFNQSYLHLGITPVVSHRYRNKYTNFWNNQLPGELEKITTSKNVGQQQPNFFNPQHYRKSTTPNPDFVAGHINMYPIKVDVDKPTEDSFRALVYKMKDPHMGMYNAAATSVISPPMVTLTTTEETTNVQQIEQPAVHDIMTSETTLTVLIIVAIIFLICNAIVIAGYLFKRNTGGQNFQGKPENNENNQTNDEKRSKFSEPDDTYILEMMRKTASVTYEPEKYVNLSNGCYTLTRQFSPLEQVDAHAKVYDWITHERTNNNPPILVVKAPSGSDKSSSGHRTPQSMTPHMQLYPQKVSVAIDATPQARSNSILRQEPIEVTKAKAFEYATPEYEEGNEGSPCSSEGTQTGSSSSSSYSCCETELIKINHKHSQSDPVVPVQYHNYLKEEGSTSFVEPFDINVTCRDKSEEKPILTPEEALKVIKRRNFPKVLPDYPTAHEIYNTASIKRRSLPPQAFHMQYGSMGKPAPPPRISSTLGRKNSHTKDSKNSDAEVLSSSPVMTAEEPPLPEDPPIALNTLQFGQLKPRNHENIYMTMQRQNSQTSQESSPEPEPSVDIICIEHKNPNDNSYIKFSDIRPPSSFKTSPPPECLTDSRAPPDSRESSTSSSSTAASSTGTIKKI